MERHFVRCPNRGLIVEQIDVFQLPTERRQFTIAGDKVANTGQLSSDPLTCIDCGIVLRFAKVYSGMVMSIHISSETEKLRVIAGYESGHTMVFQRVDARAPWQTVYRCQPHSQPGTSSLVSHVVH